MSDAASTAPETMTPREIGAQMARLREQFGLTAQEVSERLHIRPRYISAMEDGRHDLMPGKVYARGYVHTYAEFLGLDADAVANRYFAHEAPQATPMPPATRNAPSASLGRSHWRSYAVMAVGALGGLLLIAQLSGFFSSSVPEESSVSPVPDTMLESVRTQVMPTANNYDCLTDDAGPLACFYSDKVTRALVRLDDKEHLPFAGDMDVSAMAVEPKEAEATSEDKAHD